LLKIAEPTTTITDYILAAETIFLGILLFRNSATLPVRLWAFSFFVLAAAAIAGGTYHGFIGSMEAGTSQIVWKFTLYSVGLGTLLMLSASAFAFLDPPWRVAILILGILQFCAYMFLVSRSNDFKYVIYDYVPAMILIVAFSWIAKSPSAKWLLGAVALSFIGALIQRLEFQLHKHFNYNDIYHVIQMVGMYFFYRAGRLL
jgi:Family of unknown function (DUF6962)